MEEYGTNNYPILIVDTGSTDPVSKRYLEGLSVYSGDLNITVTKSIPGYSYEMAAAVTAIRNYPANKYLFIHDSIVITSDQWINQFEDKLNNDSNLKAVAWIKFQPCLFCCWDDHFNYMDQICGHDDVPDSGFFGGIFMTYGEVMREFDNKGYFDYPATTKRHSEAWERIWAILFHVNSYNTDHIIWGFDAGAIHAGNYSHIKKIFNGRQ